jgi:hypothetical protein
MDRDRVCSWIGYPKPAVTISPSPNDFLSWEALRYACDHNFKTYVTLSAAGNQRLHSYYSAKYNPELFIRYSAIKKNFLSGVVEKGYSNIIKPLRGKYL